MKHPLYFGALLTQKIIDNCFIYKKEQRRELFKFIVDFAHLVW